MIASRLRWYWLHPLLVAAYPVVFLFATNAAEQVSFDPLWLPLAVSVAAAAALLGLLAVTLRHPLAASLLTSLVAALFFGYGHVRNVLGDGLGSEAALLVCWALLLIGGAAAIWKARHARAATQAARALTVLAGLGLLVNGAGAASSVLLVDQRPADAVAAADSLEVDRAELPDIYYIVLDRYAGPDVLQQQYGFDNSAFLDALRSRGFYVATESHANYLRTPLSLVSSLSMDYLDAEQLQHEAATPGGGSPIDTRMRGSLAVPSTLTELGYRYVHVGGPWEPSATNADADQTLRYSGFSTFAAALVETTILGVLTPDAGPSDEWTGSNIRAHTLYQLDRLAETRHLPGPKYVFAHLLLPHPPFVFDVDGSVPTRRELEERGNDESYVRQLEYANRRAVELIDQLLEGEDDPVIVLQSDEGPYPDRFRAQYEEFKWRDATRDELEEKLAILNAYHLPSVDPASAGLYEGISPVNSFRVIFNAYFGTSLPLLPDRSYAQVDVHHFYDLFEVTDRLAD